MQKRLVKEEAIPRPAHRLAGKTAIVTGSTSGIGLGIARAFAASGMHVMLNGFGDKTEIQKIRADLEETYGVKITHSPADMSKPDERIDMSDEPDHDALCEREQRYLLKAIDENIDLTDHMNDAVKSLKIVIAADNSIHTGQVVAL